MTLPLFPFDSHIYYGMKRSSFRPDAIQIMHDVVKHETRQHLFTILLGPIHETEFAMNRGRFSTFHAHETGYGFEMPPLPFAVPVPGLEASAFQERLEWISQTITGRWNLRFAVQSVNDGNIIYQFEDGSDAVHFKMMWG